jgi:PadR family transcriptional regulator, regulatory protein PadR
MGYPTQFAGFVERLSPLFVSLLLTFNRRAAYSSYRMSIGAERDGGENMVEKRVDLLLGTLDLIVLKMLRSGPANGWELTQSIQVVSRGALEVNYGSIYPALRRLEARGWARGKWAVTENNRRARFYELTAAGRKQLVTEREQWEQFSAALGLILEAE